MAKKNINIDKTIYPEMNVLEADKDGTLTTTIVDREHDGIECKFNYDGCIELNTEGYSYLILSIENLLEMVDLIKKADKMYDNMPDGK